MSQNQYTSEHHNIRCTTVFSSFFLQTHFLSVVFFFWHHCNCAIMFFTFLIFVVGMLYLFYSTKAHDIVGDDVQKTKLEKVNIHYDF